MDLNRVKMLNEEILHKATTKLEERVKKGSWDEEEFKTICYALDNLKDISKMEYNKERSDANEMKMSRMMSNKPMEEETEFEKVIYKIVEERPLKDVMEALTRILSDYLEDTRVMHPKAYENIMLKLKDIM